MVGLVLVKKERILYDTKSYLVIIIVYGTHTCASYWFRNTCY